MGYFASEAIMHHLTRLTGHTRESPMNLTALAARLGKNKSTLSRHCERLKLGKRTKRGIELTDAEVTQLAAAVALARPGNPSLTRPKQ